MVDRAAFPLLLFGLLSTLPSLSAQSAKLNPGQGILTLRFVATDASGQPIADLRTEEIHVSENGKRYTLAFSRSLLLAPPAAPPALGPHEYSNRAGIAVPASTLLLIDLFNADFTDHSTVFDQTIQTLGKQESPEDVFVFFLAPDASIVPVHAWNPSGIPSSGDWPRRIRDLLDEGLRTVSKIKATHPADSNQIAAITHQALKLMGDRYSELPGPKRLIWVTRGMPLIVTGPKGPQPLVFQSLLQQTGAEFRGLGIPVCTVHQRVKQAANVFMANAVDSLAKLTGGRNFEDEAVERAIAAAQSDARGAYETGVYTDDKDADGKFHPLRVSTTRKGAHILAADSYLAEPWETIDQRNLELVQGRPFDTPDIGLRVGMETSEKTTHFQILGTCAIFWCSPRMALRPAGYF